MRSRCSAGCSQRRSSLIQGKKNRKSTVFIATGQVRGTTGHHGAGHGQNFKKTDPHSNATPPIRCDVINHILMHHFFTCQLLFVCVCVCVCVRIRQLRLTSLKFRPGADDAGIKGAFRDQLFVVREDLNNLRFNDDVVDSSAAKAPQ